MSAFTKQWVWRSRLPAQSQPNPEFPYGLAMDLRTGPGLACKVALTYPAPGVGTWLLTCVNCGMTLAVTAAGRADDPTEVTITCKEPLL
jgi:hypothetical protein